MKKHKVVILAIVFLFAAVAVLAQLNRPADKPDASRIKVFIANEAVATLTLADLQAMPLSELDKEIVSSGGDNQAGLFTGVALRALLDASAPGWEQNASSVTCRASDNFTTAFTVDEVLAEGNILVAYALDGELLPSQEEGGKGPFRLVVRDDAFGNRSTYWLCCVEVD